MKKFNDFQVHVLETALQLWSDEVKKDIANAEKKGKNHIFAPSYVDMTIADIKQVIAEQNKRTKEEEKQSEDMFYNALCNGLGYIADYGLYLQKDSQYKKAKEGLENPCYEDVLMAILRSGGTLVMLDDEDDDARYEIALKDVHERVPNAPQWAISQMLNEEDDAITADVILQIAFLNEIVFG
jgi:hypothetical protein